MSADTIIQAETGLNMKQSLVVNCIYFFQTHTLFHMLHLIIYRASARLLIDTNTTDD